MLFNYIYFLILILGITIGAIRYKLLSKSSKTILLLLVLTFLSEMTALCLRLNAQNDGIIYHFFQPLEFTLIGLVFWQELKNKVILLIILFHSIFALVNSIFIQHFTTSFNSNAYVLESFLSIFLGLWYLKTLLSEKTTNYFSNYPIFWFSLGFMIFDIINLFILGTHNTLVTIFPNMSSVFRITRYFSNYLLYILFILSFLCAQKKLNIDNPEI